MRLARCLALFMMVFCLLDAAPVVQQHYQVAVVGGGPAGLSCANVCAGRGFSTVVVDAGMEKGVQSTFPVQNWPLMQGKPWSQILELLKNDLKNSGGMFLEGKVVEIARQDEGFFVTTDKVGFACDMLVIATGKIEKPPGGAKLSKRTLLRFYTTDFLKEGETVSVVGGDEAGLRAALEIAGVASKVFVLYRELADCNTLLALEDMANVKFIHYDKILGSTDHQNRCRLAYSTGRAQLVQESSWIIFAGLRPPLATVAEGLVQIDSKGAIVTYDAAGSTNTAHLFACGEVAHNEYLSGVSSFASGVRSGVRICQQFMEEGVSPEYTPAVPKEKPPITVSEKGASKSTK